MDQTAGSSDRSFFGHPRGLGTLFFTEMWERFSYYGMRALLILYMAAAVGENNGGMGMDQKTAAAIYGLYTACVYLFALPGGWLADRLFGQRKAIWYGGILIASGHFSMAIPSDQTFFLGLVLIVLGTGLLKPNISAIVGGLYASDDQRRDAGFSIFYSGINLGAFLAPLICSPLGENIQWHYGFAAAGIGMVFGLIQFKLTERHLGDVGLAPKIDPSNPEEASQQNMARKLFYAGVAVIILALALTFSGVVPINPVSLASVSAFVILGLVLVYIIYVYIFGHLDSTEKKRVGSICILFVFSVLFWSGFEQAGSSLNIFAKELTDRNMFGWEMPAGVLQSVNPIFIIVLAPFFGMMWINLGRRNLEPSTPVKFALGLIFLGLGFGVMVLAAQIAVSGDLPLPWWLVLTYLLHTTGELALSPVGLSAVTKLAPKRLVSQMMGLWFMSISLGNLVAGLVAGELDSESRDTLPDLFLNITLFCVIAGVVLLILYKPVKKLMAGIK